MQLVAATQLRESDVAFGSPVPVSARTRSLPGDCSIERRKDDLLDQFHEVAHYHLCRFSSVRHTERDQVFPGTLDLEHYATGIIDAVCFVMKLIYISKGQHKANV
jgi:hypothetical protein